MPRTYLPAADAAVSDSFWRKRKARIERLLAQYQNSGWKTGGFTMKNCDDLRLKMLSEEQNLQRRTLANRHHVIPGIGQTLKPGQKSQVTVSDLPRMNNFVQRKGVKVKYKRRIHTQAGETIVQTDQLSDSQSKVGSLENSNHKPGGGNITVTNKQIDVSAVKSKVGSLENVLHKPRRGRVVIERHKLSWNASAKVGSLDNLEHSPGGGDNFIFDDKPRWTAHAKVGSLENIDHIPRRTHRTRLDRLSPFRRHLLEQPNVVWTEGPNQTRVKQPEYLMYPTYFNRRSDRLST